MKKEKKRLIWASAIIACISLLSLTYAALSTTLSIVGNEAKVESGSVEFVQDDSFAYSIGTDYDSTASGYGGPYYYNNYQLKDNTSSPSYALANAGTVIVGRNISSPDSKKNDLTTISGTRLFDYGAYVVYKLKLKNTASVPMKLTHFDPVELTNSIVSSSTSENNIKDNVGVEIYTDPSLEIPLSEWNGATTDGPNYLRVTGTTDWYVKIFHKAPTTGVTLDSGDLEFSVKPVWTSAFE